MKHSKLTRLLVAVIAAVVTAVAFVACSGTHTHEWGPWSLDQEPTLTEQGKASHACKADDGAEETVDVPALSDENVWTKDPAQHQDPTETEPGKDVYTSEYGSVTVVLPATGGGDEHSHEWGPWTLEKEPTLTETGVAHRDCTSCDEGHETKDNVPALNDESVWTKDAAQHQDPTPTEPGKDVYTSEYGSVTVVLPATGGGEHTTHVWGEWTLEKEPTLTAGGKAKHTCTANDGGEETVDVPALLCAPWTKSSESVAPTLSTDGKDVYTSEYGKVEVALSKIAGTYVGINFSESGFCQKSYYASYQRKNVAIADGGALTDEDGYIANGQIAADGFDAQTGLITYTTTEEDTHYLFYDPASGILVQGGYTDGPNVISEDILVLSKFGWVDKSMIDYVGLYGLEDPENENSNHDIYAYLVETFINAEQTEKALIFIYHDFVGAVSATDALGNPYETLREISSGKTIVVKAGDKTLYARAAVGESLNSASDSKPLDVYAGTYHKTDADDLTLDGGGGAKLGELTGTYTVAEDKDYTIDLYVDLADGGKEYYEVTLDKDNAAYTSVKPVVSVTFDTDGKDTAFETEHNKDYNKNIEIKVPKPADTEEYFFRGWFTDAAHESELSGDGEGGYVYTPTEGATLYALWVKKVDLTIHYNDNATSDKVETVGEGDSVTVEKPVQAGKKFVGWFTDKDTLETPWGEIDPASGETTGTVNADTDIYAKWGEPDPYVGKDYHAVTVDDDVTITDELTVTFDADGVGTAGGTTADHAPFLSGAVEGEKYPGFPDYGTVTYAYSISVNSYDPDTKEMVIRSKAETDEPPYTKTTVDYKAYLVDGDLIFMNKDGKEQSDRNFPVWSDLYVLTTDTGVAAESIKTSTFDVYDVKNVKTLTARALSVTASGKTTTILLYGDEVFFDVSFKTKAEGGEDIAADAVNGESAPALYIFDAEDSLLISFGYLADYETYILLDGLEGEYTESETSLALGKLTLDGLSNLEAGIAQFETDTDGTYIYYMLDEETHKVAVVKLDVEGEYETYYEVALDTEAHTYSIVKPTVNVKYELNGHGTLKDEIQATLTNVNVKVDLVLPKVDDEESYLFKGWFIDDSTFAHAVSTYNGKWTPEADMAVEGTITLYAKWVKKVKVTVHYDNGADQGLGYLPGTETLVCGEGETVTPEEPGAFNGKGFKAWHKDSLQGEIWTPDDPIEADTDIYCEWQDAVEIFGTWAGYNVYGSDEEGGSATGWRQPQFLTVDVDGTVSSGPSTYQGGMYSAWDEEQRTFTIVKEELNNTYYGSLDLENGVMVLTADSAESLSGEYDFNIYVLRSVSETVNVAQGSYWKGTANGSIKLVELQLDHGTMIVFIKDGIIYGKVSVEKTLLPDVEEDSHPLSYLWRDYALVVVKDSKGAVIGRYVHDDTYGLVESDGLDGTYTVADGEASSVTLDGKGGITYGDNKGAYAKQAEGEKYDVYLTSPAAYYEMELTSKEEPKTATMTKVMVSLTFKTQGDAIPQETKSLNKNIPVALPVLTNDTLLTTGWFTDDACTESVELDKNGLYVPTVETTLYAKTAEKATIHIVYGDHGPEDDIDVPFEKNKTPDLAAYVPAQDGKWAFDGWFTDADCAEEHAYEPEELSGDITLYAKWVEKTFEIVTEGCEHPWTEAEGTWSSSIVDIDDAQSELKIVIYVDGTLKFDWTCDSEEFSDKFHIYIASDPAGSDKVDQLSNGYGYGESGRNKSGTFEKKLKAGQVVILVYVKDGGIGSGTDTCTASNISFAASGEAAGGGTSFAEQWQSGAAAIYDTMLVWKIPVDVLPFLNAEVGFAEVGALRDSGFVENAAVIATGAFADTDAYNAYIASYKALLLENGWKLSDEKDSHKSNADLYVKDDCKVSFAQHANYGSGQRQVDIVVYSAQIERQA